MSTSDERLARRASTALPETGNAADVTSWSDEVDVLVIGFGIAGGSAAVSAAAAGARVLVLERAAAAGGTSAMAGGHFYLGGGTAVQEATGHQDSPEEMYKYLVAVSRAPEHDKIREYCEGSVEHFNWLEDLGFQFERSFYPGKIVVPPGTEGLSYTGNEKVWPYIEQANLYKGTWDMPSVYKNATSATGDVVMSRKVKTYIAPGDGSDIQDTLQNPSWTWLNGQPNARVALSSYACNYRVFAREPKRRAL